MVKHMPHALTLADISTPRSTWWHDDTSCAGQQRAGAEYGQAKCTSCNTADVELGSWKQGWVWVCHKCYEIVKKEN
jgi:hypothetical protein